MGCGHGYEHQSTSVTILDSIYSPRFYHGAHSFLGNLAFGLNLRTVASRADIRPEIPKQHPASVPKVTRVA